MPNEVELGLSTAAAEQKIERLRQQIAQLKAEATSLGNQIGTGSATPEQLAQFRGTVAQIAGAQGALNALQSSVASGPSGGPTTASQIAAAAVAGASPFAAPARVRNVPFADPVAAFGNMQSMLPGLSAAALYTIGQAMGNGGMPMPQNFNAAQMAVSLVQSAQSSRILGPNGLPLNSGSAGGVSPLGPSMPLTATNANAFYAQLSPNYVPGTNPFLGEPAIGPATSLNPASANAARLQYEEQMRFQRRLAWGTVAYGATTALAGGLGLMASNTANGVLDPMSAAGVYGGVLGGAAGGVIGMKLSPTAPGVGLATGWLMGQQLGSAAMEKVIAPYVRTRTAAIELSSYAARSGLSPYDFILPGRVGGSSLDEIQEEVSFGGKSALEKTAIKLGLYTGTDITSTPDLARIVSTLGSAYLASGQNPRGLVMEDARALAKRYGLAAPGMAQRAGNVIANENRFGMNKADLILNAGLEDYGAYADLTGLPAVTRQQTGAVARIQRAGYDVERTGLQARGFGRASVDAYDRMLSALEDLPDGRNSLAYMQTSAQRRNAVRTAFGEYAGEQFELPLMRTEGALRRARLAPFMPGYTFGLEMTAMGQRNVYARAIGTYRNERRRRGELSVAEDLSLEGQLQDLWTANMASVATIADGGPNLMASLTSGGPAGFRRFDSLQMAAVRIGAAGHPRRSYGAMGGRQARMQDEFVTGFGLGDMGPVSRGGMLGSTDLRETNDLLRRLVNAVEREGASFSRPRRGSGDLAPSGGYVQSGNDAPWN